MPTYDDSLSIEEAIRRVFPRTDPQGVRQMLDQAQDRAGRELDPRVELAALLLSEGDLGKLH